ncbi:MAG: ester cyclase [Acidimicrobiia bacterium]
MSVEVNKELTLRFYDEAINKGNLDLIDDLVAADFVEHEGFPGLPTSGPEAPKAALGLFMAGFSDLNMSADDVIAEGDKVVVRGTMSGTHTGEFMGIPATNQSFSIQFIDILEIRDGKAIAHWGVTDQAAMMGQLGLAPEM